MGHEPGLKRALEYWQDSWAAYQRERSKLAKTAGNFMTDRKRSYPVISRHV